MMKLNATNLITHEWGKQAQSLIPAFDGYTIEIATYKWQGKLSTHAHVCVFGDAGSFQTLEHRAFGDYSVCVIMEDKRATERAILKQHAQVIDLFGGRIYDEAAAHHNARPSAHDRILFLKQAANLEQIRTIASQ